jgi:hypothetical protein
MRTSARAKSIGKSFEFPFPDRRQDLCRHALDYFVLQRRYPQRSPASIRLRQILPPHRLGPVGAPGQPPGQVCQVAVQFLPVMRPGLPIHPGCRLLFQSPVGCPQVVFGVDVMVQRGEFGLRLLSYGCTNALQRRLHPYAPALRPVGWALLLIPLVWRPSLHPLRPSRSVRGLLRYYASIRLPRTVHQRLPSSDFPLRPIRPSPGWAVLGSPDSRSKCFQAPLGSPTSPCPPFARAFAEVVLPSPTLTGSAHGSIPISRLNTQLACSPTNASPMELLPFAHGAGLVWFATP